MTHPHLLSSLIKPLGKVLSLRRGIHLRMFCAPTSLACGPLLSRKYLCHTIIATEVHIGRVCHLLSKSSNKHTRDSASGYASGSKACKSRRLSIPFIAVLTLHFLEA